MYPYRQDYLSCFFAMLTSSVLGLFALAIGSGTIMSVCFKFLTGFSPYVVSGIGGLVFGLFSLCIGMFLGVKIQEIIIHPAMLVLGCALVGLNISYSLLYGAQVPTSYVPIVVTGVMTVALGIAGWQLFGEAITWNFIIGTVLILVGMVIMVR